VQYGFLREGMSADALRFVWGEPARVQGDARRSAHWYYVGAFHALSLYGNQYSDSSHEVDVYLAHGKVVAWGETFPPAPRPDTGGGRHR
jgi:outer membrane protein assembly factor BamE (lipoprotein component of BamABCDE complex)